MRTPGRWRNSASEPMAAPTHEPVMVAETLDAAGAVARRRCSSTARSDSAATRGRCSRRARRGSSGSIATPTPCGRRRERSAEFGDRVELVHADYRDLPRVLDERGAAGGRRRAGRSRACRRCSSTTEAAASASGATIRSTCGWISSQGPTAADLLATVDEESLADVISSSARSATRGGSRAAIVAARQLAADPRPPGRSRRSCGGRFRGAASSGSIRRPGRSRRCASGSTASSKGSSGSCRRPCSACSAARGSPSSRFTRSRIAS